MKLYNGTSSAIRIIGNAVPIMVGTTARWSVKEKPEIVEIIPRNKPLFADFAFSKIGMCGDAIPVYKKYTKAIDTLPEGYTMYIVSRIYAMAFLSKFGPDAATRLYTIVDPVYDENRKMIVGCRGIEPVF